MRQRNRQRHQLLRLRRRIPKHHPLIPSTSHIQNIIIPRIRPRLPRRIHPLRNIRRLLINRIDHRTRITIKPKRRIRIPNPPHRLPRHMRNIHIRRRRDLPRNQHQPRIHQRLTRHPTKRIIHQHRIQNPIRNLISNLVRMPLSHRLRRKQKLVIGIHSHRIWRNSSAVESVSPLVDLRLTARTLARSGRSA